MSSSDESGANVQRESGGVIISVLGAIIASQGGIDGIINKMQASGWSSLVASWSGTGTNEPISSEQVQNAIGDEHLQNLTDRSGLPKPELLTALAQNLPTIVDRLTPKGNQPEGGLTAGAIELLRSLRTA